MIRTIREELRYRLKLIKITLEYIYDLTYWFSNSCFHMVILKHRMKLIDGIDGSVLAVCNCGWNKVLKS